MQTNTSMKNLDDMTAEVIGLGRQAADRALALPAGDTTQDAAFVRRCLATLKDRQPFNPKYEGGCDAVLRILDRSIASECLGMEEKFQQTGHDEYGPQGEMQEVPVYSERGAELVELQNLLKAFLEKRDTVLDLVAAQQFLIKITV